MPPVKGRQKPLVLWYCQNRPTDRQAAELKQLYGGSVVIDPCGPLRTAIAASERKRLSGAADVVAVAPWSRLLHLVECGVHPLYSLGQPCAQDDPERDFSSADGRRHFRFVGYMRLADAQLVSEAAKPLSLPSSRPVNVGWVSRYAVS